MPLLSDLEAFHINNIEIKIKKCNRTKNKTIKELTSFIKFTLFY